jgi:hypothetical protein
MKETQYGYQISTDLKYDDAITKVTEELKKEGFGILTEINVKSRIRIGIRIRIRINCIDINSSFLSVATQYIQTIRVISSGHHLINTG